MKIQERLSDCPVIAAVRSEEEFCAALAAPAEVLFLLSASILTVAGQLERAHTAGKAVLVHIDLAEGIGKDAAGVQFLRQVGVDGVISTRSSVIRAAKECGLCAVQRFFMVDSHSIVTAVEAIHATAPDFVELMPGVIPKIVHRFCENCAIPVIAGGLIDTKEEILAALGAGATAVSAGNATLWSL